MINLNETDRTAGGNAGCPVSLYLHFPFCVRKCRYCDFLSGPADGAVRKRYLRALEREAQISAEIFRNERVSWNLSGQPKGSGRFEAADGKALCIDTVFIGGGTPSLMSGTELQHLMRVLRENFRILPDAEITMECNPGTVDQEKLTAFRKAGVNRLSIGVQSFRDEELRLLGRIHTADEARTCFLDARAAGFDNISLDLISALPGQSGAQWMESLREAVRLFPEHISAYSLILEDGTPLKEEEEAGKLSPVPEEELDRKMYHDTKEFLAQYGYHRYEISNYAREDFESRHNSGYWTGHPYLGFGIGAASYFGNRRWSHTRSLVKYLEILEKTVGARKEIPEGLYEEEEILNDKDRMAEFMFLGLRRMRGVSEKEFERRFGRSMESVYGLTLNRYQKFGMLKREEGKVFLTDAGIDVSNAVMADFLLD